MQAFYKILVGAVLFYIGYCCLLFLFQRQLIFPRYLIPSPSNDHQPAAGIEKIWIDIDAARVEAWYMPPKRQSPQSPAPLVIFGHGNGELIDFWPETLKRFTRLGMGLLLVEYPGYGRSTGSPSQKTITEAFVRAYDKMIRREEIDPSKIILFGRSIGGAAICTLAAERPSAALILMSTFTGLHPFAIRYLAPKFLVRDPFDNLKTVSEYTAPVLIMHGRHDTIIPYPHGVKLHGAGSNSKMITYEAGHNDCPPDWEQFWQDIEAFLLTNGFID